LSRLGDVVEARITRLFLVVLIIVSLLPFVQLERALRPLFLVVFGCEIGVRIAILWVRRPPSAAESTFALVDLCAFASFLPLERWLSPEQATLFTLMRLMRLLVLLRFARELASDIYGIVTRREQLHQFSLITAAVFMLAFVAAVILSHMQLTPPGEHGGSPSFFDHLWWAFRQLESADNLVATVRVHPMLVALSLGLTITGVFVVSYIIGIGANVVAQVLRTEQLRPVGYRDHALVVGPLKNAEVLIREFVRIYEKNRKASLRPWREIWAWLGRGAPPPRSHALPRVALLGVDPEPPAYLHEPGMRWVVYRKGDGADPDALTRVAAAQAKRAILLAPENAGHDVDALTLSALTALRSLNPSVQVCVELHGENGCDIARAVGGAGTFPLDVPRFLGLLLCQHLVVPGVERLYGDLLGIESSEFYTHIFVDKSELAAIDAMERDHLSFACMARAAYRAYGVVLTGVFLGDPPRRARRSRAGGSPEPGRRRARDLGTDRLVQWLNPAEAPPADSRVAALGGAADKVPRAALRGLIGVADSYLPMRRYAHAFLAERKNALAGRETVAPAAARVVERLIPARGVPRRILIVGFSPALRSLLEGLVRFVPDADILVVMGARGDEAVPLAWRLEMLAIGISHTDPPPGHAGRELAIGQARVRVFTHEGPDLAGFAEECVRAAGAVDAAVFLSEPQAVDRDARTAMRVLRFARGLETGHVPHGERLHVLAEFWSLRKGDHLEAYLDSKRCGFADPSHLHVTIVSTDEIKNYFMVHSSFVPGVTAIYDELLSEHGQEIVRLELDGPSGEDLVTFGELADALRPRAAVPIAVELEHESVVINPAAQRRFPVARISAIYAIADAQRHGEPF
jgi:hypothetical protein